LKGGIECAVLSQGIRENATDNAIAGVIMNMYENNFTLEQIAVATKKVWKKSGPLSRKESLYWYNHSNLIVVPYEKLCLRKKSLFYWY